MMHTFNLLKKPWLPCIDPKNRVKMLNLVDAITEAQHLKAIQAELPITTGALYVFLIAFVKAAINPNNDDAWEAIWQRGAFPYEAITRYGEQWEDRFDLFDRDHPFYQDPKLGTRPKDIQNLVKGKSLEPKGISGLLLHLASGNNATLFDHSVDDLPKSYSPAETARLLIMLQSNSLGGMSSASISKDKYYKDSPFGRGILFLNRGVNLFQTVLLNLIPKDFDPLDSVMNDQPVWELEDPFESEKLTPTGMLDFLTWQSRRILLIPENIKGEVVVQNCYTAPGLGLVETFNNPLYHIRYVKRGSQQKTPPLRFQEGRSLWRDSAAILDVKSENSVPALPIQWYARLKAQDIVKEETVQLDLYGMCTEPGQKKAYFYAQESFSAPAYFLEDRSALEALHAGLNQAEQVRSDLYLATRELARFKVAPFHDKPDGKSADTKAVEALMQHINAEQFYWSKLEPAFYTYIMSLPKSDQAHDIWQQSLRVAARGALAYASDLVGTDPPGLKARAKAEESLARLLYKTFNTQTYI